jgi:hypothetical protein
MNDFFVNMCICYVNCPIKYVIIRLTLLQYYYTFSLSSNFPFNCVLYDLVNSFVISYTGPQIILLLLCFCF